ncbi:BrnA antitoxin family protein [Afifella sp. JA880]|uniref:BrnA antitoxin family protein n=1 Tax=unclassified Afifella TaxID=2624128 RepID=UPI0021BB4CEE|nr:BrnA antitoxin family protein [Afifella sp. JA880]MCT8266651.1 BrnA antitoxin family protein [Afifella sp. JA880]
MNKRYDKELTLEELAAIRDEDIDYSDIPELGEWFWKNAKIVYPDSRAKKQLTLRLDADIVEFFKAEGRGYQTRMNAVLRSYVDAVRK